MSRGMREVDKRIFLGKTPREVKCIYPSDKYFVKDNTYSVLTETRGNVWVRRNDGFKVMMTRNKFNGVFEEVVR